MLIDRTTWQVITWQWPYHVEITWPHDVTTTWFSGGDHYQKSDANSGSWSLTDYLRAGIDKIDVNAINQTFNSWTEKLGTRLPPSCDLWGDFVGTKSTLFCVYVCANSLYINRLHVSLNNRGARISVSTTFCLCFFYLMIAGIYSCLCMKLL